MITWSKLNMMGTLAAFNGQPTLGLVAALIVPPSPIAAVAVVALLVFHAVLGWKLLILSRTS